MITLTDREWDLFKPQLEQEYGKTIILLRYKMKETLGCTYRYGDITKWPNREVHLDFFDDAAETFFRMKYL